MVCSLCVFPKIEKQAKGETRNVTCGENAADTFKNGWLLFVCLSVCLSVCLVGRLVGRLVGWFVVVGNLELVRWLSHLFRFFAHFVCASFPLVTGNQLIVF